MVNIDEFTLISGADVKLPFDVTVLQPTLLEIRQLGYDVYQQYLSVLLLERDQILQVLGVELSEVPEEVTLYAILSSQNLEGLREQVLQALSFFVAGECTWPGCSLVIDGRQISLEEYCELRRAICRTAYLAVEPERPRKFANAASKRIWEKLQKGRAALQKAKKADRDMELPNVIAAVAAAHGGYTMFNIWQLTVYQLYDQFARVNTKMQLSIYGQRWATWGEKEFDTSLWFKSTMRKEDK